jgi:hypothetical protein
MINTPSYWVLRGVERWIIYRNGSIIVEGTPQQAQTFLAGMQSLGCNIVYGD